MLCVCFVCLVNILYVCCMFACVVCCCCCCFDVLFACVWCVCCDCVCCVFVFVGLIVFLLLLPLEVLFYCLRLSSVPLYGCVLYVLMSVCFVVRGFLCSICDIVCVLFFCLPYFFCIVCFSCLFL